MARTRWDAAISRTCALARYLESRIAETPELELLAPVELNIVCFRYRADECPSVNARIVIDLQESGSVAPSTTIIDGRLAIRAAIVNHRTSRSEIDTLVDKTVALGRAMEASAAESRAPQRQPGADWPPERARESALRDLSDRIASNPRCDGSAISSWLPAGRDGPDPGSQKRVSRVLLARASPRTGGIEQSGHAAVRHRISNGRAHGVRGSRRPASRRSHEPRESGQCLYENGELQAAREHCETSPRESTPAMPEAHQGLVATC